MDVNLAIRTIDTWATENNLPDKVDYRDLNIAPGEIREIDAADQLWVVEFADEGLRIESDLGVYELRNDLVNENAHRHTGQLTIQNSLTTTLNVAFVVGIGR